MLKYPRVLIVVIDADFTVPNAIRGMHVFVLARFFYRCSVFLTLLNGVRSYDRCYASIVARP